MEDSLVAQRVTYDAVLSAGGVAALPIPKALIQAVRNASAKRIEAAKKKVEDAESSRRKRVAQQIKELESKKAKIEQTSRDEAQALSHELKKLRDTLKK